MRILFEDPQLIVCEKPAGVSAQEKDGKTDLPALLRQATGAEAIYPVHRMDTAVGGAMVFAKTKAAAAALSAAVQTEAFQKTYLCAVHGAPSAPEGVLEDLLFHDRQKNKTFVVKRERRGVKSAKLAYTVLSSAETPAGAVSLLRVRLFTGRTHQIRVQFASRRLPLLGDGKYGGRDGFRAPALFCCALSFPHPGTGERLSFTLRPPETQPWRLFPAELYSAVFE